MSEVTRNLEALKRALDGAVEKASLEPANPGDVERAIREIEMKIEFSQSLIAPCGMNCGICKAFLRKNNPCHGCNDAALNKPKTRVHCGLRICGKRRGKFCCDCAEFPCDRLRRLDRRYRTRYGMSQIENLEFIRDNGIRKFVAAERRRWTSEKGTFCVHDKKYYAK